MPEIKMVLTKHKSGVESWNIFVNGELRGSCANNIYQFSRQINTLWAMFSKDVKIVLENECKGDM